MSVTELISTLVLLCILAMSGAWLVQRLTGNAGWVDAVWSFATAAAGVLAALTPLGAPAPRQTLVAALIAAWGLRLGLHIARRSAAGVEDVRYAALRREWGAGFQPRMFWFLQIQALAAFLLALGVLLAARNPAPLGPADALGALVLAIAVLGEALADRQLAAFKSRPDSHGKVCDTGLWAWSRHPNYFFEWLVWCACPCFAISAAWPWGWPALLAPAMMYWLLVHVSGIPPLEAAMLKSRGPAYRAYQQRVAAFFPRPPRSSR